jgi:hypothetical protein
MLPLKINMIAEGAVPGWRDTFAEQGKPKSTLPALGDKLRNG